MLSSPLSSYHFSLILLWVQNEDPQGINKMLATIVYTQSKPACRQYGLLWPNSIWHRSRLRGIICQTTIFPPRQTACEQAKILQVFLNLSMSVVSSIDRRSTLSGERSKLPVIRQIYVGHCPMSGANIQACKTKSNFIKIL